MFYCLNPNCIAPKNTRENEFCHACGEQLNTEYQFRDRYQVVGFLGQGGFGRTYKIEDLNFQRRPRVLKKLIISGSEEAVEIAKTLFQREAAKLDEIKHAQIPSIYDHFEEGNSLYLVQEFVLGETLDKELNQQGCWGEEKIIDLLEQLLPVLAYLHSEGLVHRDIKPDNIIRRSHDGRLFLIDFGGVKEVATTIGTILYTPGYAPIEQMRGKPNLTSDIYSLGVTCVRLMTGFLPPVYSTQDEIYNEDEDKWIWKEKLQEQGRTVSKKLEAVLDKMLAHLSKNRFQSALDILKILQGLQEISPEDSAPLPSVNTSIDVTVSSPTPTPPAFLKPVGLQTYNFKTLILNKRGQVVQTKKGQAKYYTENLGRGITLDMVAIPRGVFWMGAAGDEKEASKDEYPQHQVRIAAFHMSKFPITQTQWRALFNTNPASFLGDNHPVERVNWYQALEFCRRLSKLTGKEYTLPSEAQWEYACRAGTTTPFYCGETITSELANFNGNRIYAQSAKGIYREKTTTVGQFPPNGFGLYDMYGNVWEWCLDSWHENYQGAPDDGSAWDYEITNDTQKRVLRGGSWYCSPGQCRSASRLSNIPNDGFNYGFRVVWLGKN